MVLHITACMSKVGGEYNMYKNPSITQSNPPSGTGHAMFGSGVRSENAVAAELGVADESE